MGLLFVAGMISEHPRPHGAIALGFGLKLVLAAMVFGRPASFGIAPQHPGQQRAATGVWYRLGNHSGSLRHDPERIARGASCCTTPPSPSRISSDLAHCTMPL